MRSSHSTLERLISSSKAAARGGERDAAVLESLSQQGPEPAAAVSSGREGALGGTMGRDGYGCLGGAVGGVGVGGGSGGDIDEGGSGMGIGVAAAIMDEGFTVRSSRGRGEEDVVLPLHVPLDVLRAAYLSAASVALSVSM